MLADPDEDLSALQRQVLSYPSQLGEALVAGLWEADFSLDNARKAVSRADTAYISGCLFRAVELCAYALHGRAGRWLVNEKGAVAAAGRLPEAPAGFTGRGHGVLANLGDRPEELRTAIDEAAALLIDVRARCDQYQ